MKRNVVLLCAVAVLLLIGSVMGSLLTKFTFAEPGGTVSIPKVINYQGLLTDKGTGQPLTGSWDVTFSLYESNNGTSPLWSETHIGVVLNRGLFNVLLGSINPLSADLFTGERFLALKVGTDAEMTPRQRLASVPYALRTDKANEAATIADGAVSYNKLGSDVKERLAPARGQIAIGPAGDAELLAANYTQLGPTVYQTGTEWRPTSISGAPLARYEHTAVWTGSEMLIWGGKYGTGLGQWTNTGGRYNPATDNWTEIGTQEHLRSALGTPRYGRGARCSSGVAIISTNKIRVAVTTRPPIPGQR